MNNTSDTRIDGILQTQSLYDEADKLVGDEPGTLVISGSATDLALIEEILQRLQIVKQSSSFRASLTNLLNAPNGRRQ